MRIFTLFLLLATRFAFGANPYWVSSTGTASWLAAQSATPLSGASATTITLMNANVSAGDTVYLRGGTYNISPTTYTGAISPLAGGTEANRIVIRAYASEVPLLVNGNQHPGFAGGYVQGINLLSQNCISIIGLKFENFDWWAKINGSDSIELGYCEFYLTDAYILSGGSSFGIFIAVNGSDHATNCWVHDNLLHNLTEPSSFATPPSCAENGDILRIGSFTPGDNGSDHTTVERNLIYGAGHTLTDFFTHYNVIRNNIGLNFGFKQDSTITGTATGGSSTRMIDTTANFATAFGGSTCVNRLLHDLDDHNAFGAKFGQVTALETTMNPNDTVVFGTYNGPTPSFVSGHRYAIGCAYLTATNSPSFSKYGHRCFHIDSGTRAALDYNLFECNRAGYASSNPNNNGADGLSLSSGSCIVRFNSLYGCGGPGLYFKNGSASCNNRVYNNTIFANGRFSGTDHPVAPIVRVGIYGTSAATNNTLINNIIYGNTAQFQYSGASVITFSNLCETADAWCAMTADPKFRDATLSLTDTNLPDLQLQESSPAINKGCQLTQATGAGSSSVTLIVVDASYFQDGTWGSTLAGHKADRIAVGTVTNVVRITSINYATQTLTLEAPITWSNGASVWLYSRNDDTVVLNGSAPDMGAYEYVTPDNIPRLHTGLRGLMGLR